MAALAGGTACAPLAAQTAVALLRKAARSCEAAAGAFTPSACLSHRLQAGGGLAGHGQQQAAHPALLLAGGDTLRV